MKKLNQIRKTFFLLYLAMSIFPVLANNPWKLHSTMNIARNVFALVPCNGKLYAIGGENQTILKSVEVYDPVSKAWHLKNDMPEPLSWCQGFDIDGIIYIVCNQTTNFNWTKVVYAYNTVTDSWARKADMPVCTPYMKAVLVEGYIHVLTSSSLIKYDHTTDEWKIICMLDSKRDNDVTCIGLGNRIYSVGKAVNVFDMKTKEWTVLKPLPTPRTGIGLAVANQRIYSISGWIENSSNWYSRHLESFQPQTGEWTIKHNLPQVTNHLPAYASMNGKIYYAGGLIEPRRYSTTLRTVYEYDPAQDTVNTLTDYDGNSYNTIKIGNQTWMKENLRAEHYADGKKIEGVFDYENSAENGEIYGKLYTLDAATKEIHVEKTQGACPVGWHLPDSTEWIELIDYLGGKKLAGEKMKADSYLWSDNTKSSNQSGFSALPSGMIVSGNNSFLSAATFFWSSSPSGNGNGWVYDLYCSSSGIEKDYCQKSDAVSVRCLKNKPKTGVNEKKETKYSVYPNPFHSDVTFSFNSGENDKISLFIYNMRGETVFSKIDHNSGVERQITWESGMLPENSVYIYRVMMDKQLFADKIFKR